MHEMAQAKTPKSEQTRALILETAMRLFQERGYDKTTMRAIAQEAGVSVGNAYYYFASKEHLVQGFYDRLGAEHKAAALAAMRGVDDLGERIRLVLTTWLEVAAPYRAFATQFFKNAADPSSPLSPFSAESVSARETVIDRNCCGCTTWASCSTGCTTGRPVRSARANWPSARPRRWRARSGSAASRWCAPWCARRTRCCGSS